MAKISRPDLRGNRADGSIGSADVEEYKRLLNDEKFVEFIDSYGDEEIDPTTPEGLQALDKRHEAYTLGKETAPAIKKLYRERIINELGIKISDQEMAEVDNFVMEAARENPEALAEIMSDMAEFRELEDKIGGAEEQIEAEIEAIGGSGALRWADQLMRLGRDKGAQRIPLIGRFFKGDALQTMARVDLAKYYGISPRQIGEQRESVRHLQELRGEMDRLGTLRERVFVDFGPAQAVYEKARTKLQDELRKLSDPSKGIKEWEQAQALVERARGASRRTSRDYLEGFSFTQAAAGGEAEATQPLTTEEIVGQLNERIDQKVADTIKDEVKKSTKFSAFERALDQIIKRGRIGSRTAPEEKREFVRKTLQALAPEASPARKLFIKMFLVGLEAE